jgi:hypothetical protein
LLEFVRFGTFGEKKQHELLMATDFKYDVFLSHSAKDKAVVLDIAERLRGDGLRVWFDE